MRNKRGKIVSKKASAVRRKLYEKSTIKVWAECVDAARKALNLRGFVAINGKLAEGARRRVRQGQGPLYRELSDARPRVSRTSAGVRCGARQ
jgi:hypothetical protein